MNVTGLTFTLPQSITDEIAQKLHLIGQPARLRILLAIGVGEACVCHLEAGLGYRQAYISQQLMLLRDAGMVCTRRVGKHIYYSLSDVQTIDLIRLAGVASPERFQSTETPISGCVCPRCSPNQSEATEDEEQVEDPDRSSEATR